MGVYFSDLSSADFAVGGSQILFDRCTGSGDSTFYFATQDRGQGPIVLLHCRFTGNGHMQPHQRWFTGLLVDNCEVPGGGIDMMNRGEMGTGHGWAIGWGVAWNNSAQSFAMNTPPGSMIWSIGNQGEETDPAFPLYDGGPPRPRFSPPPSNRQANLSCPKASTSSSSKNASAPRLSTTSATNRPTQRLADLLTRRIASPARSAISACA